jgi:hypothetical protein
MKEDPLASRSGYPSNYRGVGRGRPSEFLGRRAPLAGRREGVKVVDSDYRVKTDAGARPVAGFSVFTAICLVLVTVLLMGQFTLRSLDFIHFNGTTSFEDISSSGGGNESTTAGGGKGRTRVGVTSPSIEWITLIILSSVMTVAGGYGIRDRLSREPERVGKRLSVLAIWVGWGSLAILSIWAGANLFFTGNNPFSNSDLGDLNVALAEEMEPLVFTASCMLGAVASVYAFSTRTHVLYKRNTVDEGIVSLSMILATVWIGYVILFHADPSVKGFYAFSYFMMGVGSCFFLGKFGGRLVAGVRDVDVYERESSEAAIVQGALILATGIIFGGSLWGEADPDGEGEGGWWIPVIFFINGWAILLLLAVIGWRRVVSHIGVHLKNKREVSRVISFALYTVSCSLIIFGQVSGDFYGWSHGILAVVSVGALLVAQEILVVRRKGEEKAPDLGTEFVVFVGVLALYFFADRFSAWLPL